MKDECKYRLPCGWCDRQNKKCELNQNLEIIKDIKTVPSSESDSAISSVSYAPKRCITCNMTDGFCYTSNPHQVRCKITGRLHYYDDICDCDTITAQG